MEALHVLLTEMQRMNMDNLNTVVHNMNGGGQARGGGAGGRRGRGRGSETQRISWSKSAALLPVQSINCNSV